MKSSRPFKEATQSLYGRLDATVAWKRNDSPIDAGHNSRTSPQSELSRTKGTPFSDHGTRHPKKWPRARNCGCVPAASRVGRTANLPRNFLPRLAAISLSEALPEGRMHNSAPSAARATSTHLFCRSCLANPTQTTNLSANSFTKPYTGGEFTASRMRQPPSWVATPEKYRPARVHGQTRRIALRPTGQKNRKSLPPSIHLQPDLLFQRRLRSQHQRHLPVHRPQNQNQAATNREAQPFFSTRPVSCQSREKDSDLCADRSYSRRQNDQCINFGSIHRALADNPGP